MARNSLAPKPRNFLSLIDSNMPESAKRELATYVDPQLYAQSVAEKLRDTVGIDAIDRNIGMRGLDAMAGGDLRANQAANRAEYGQKLQDMALNYNPGAVGMFVAPKDFAKVLEAKKLLDSGNDAASVWQQTGIGFPKQLGGFAKSEISDDAAQFTSDAVKQFNDFGARQQKRVFNHPELYAAEPDLATSTVLREVGDNYSGTFYPDKNSIGLAFPRTKSKTDLQSLKDVNLHELQHLIQKYEGWMRGGNPNSSLGAGLNKENTMDWAKKAYENVHSQLDDPLLAELFDGAKPWDQLSKREQLGWIQSARNEAYNHLAGEAEARLTQYRMNLTPKERLEQYPYDPVYFKKATGVDIDQLINAGIWDNTVTGTKPTVLKAWERGEWNN